MSDRKQVLQQEIEDLRAQITALEASLEEKPEYGLGKGDPAITRRELNQALLEQLRERASSMVHALQDLEGYGVCARCGQPIHPDRLAVLPNTKLCVACAKADHDEIEV